MTERVSKQKPRTTKTREEVETAPSTADEKTALKEELDALLDEIDGVLEQNAEEFVKQYIQKGGQ